MIAFLETIPTLDFHHHVGSSSTINVVSVRMDLSLRSPLGSNTFKWSTLGVTMESTFVVLTVRTRAV